MDLEKIERIMSKFESQFEALDVQSATVENAMAGATTLSAPESDVNALIQQVADENGLEIEDQLKDLQPGQASLESRREAQQQDDLSRR